MSSRKSKQEKVKKVLLTSAICLILFGIGYFMLNNLSTREKPPLGVTFNVVMGCILMSVALIVLLTTLKKHFFPKRKKSSSRPVFLNDELSKSKTSKNHT